MQLLISILVEAVNMLYLAAPFLLLGLIMAGFIHVLLPARFIERWMGRPGMSGVVWAGLIGVPLPVCSCGVVPIAVELKRKKASDAASLSFLTTTPESGVDSILFTWSLMGPVMAIVRPIAAFFTAVIGGILAIAYLPVRGRTPRSAPSADEVDCGCDHSHDGHAEDGHSHDGEDHSHGIAYSRSDEALASLRAWFASLWRWLPRRKRKQDEDGSGTEPASSPEQEPASRAPAELWKPVIKPALGYGFRELLDDLAFWLVIGVGLAGVLSAVLPSDLAERGLGSGLAPMLLMVVVGVPLYMCASASTPIAAALMAKGLSPGAALVFLLAGPATNAASVVLLTRTFGRRFIQVYLVAVVLGSLLSGLALDALIAAFGWQIALPMLAGEDGGWTVFGTVCFVLMVLLLLASAWRGALRAGWHEMRAGFSGARDTLGVRGPSRRVLLLGLAGLVLAAWLASGFVMVPVDGEGFLLRFGRLTEAHYGPGLHWVPPAPLARLEIRQAHYPRKADVGFQTDLDLLQRREELTRFRDPKQWHSPVAAMNPDPEQVTFFTADENLVEMSFTVHYRLDEPRKFFFDVDHRQDFVELYAEAAARRYLASGTIDDLLTVARPEVEREVAAALQTKLDALDVGVEVTAVRIVDIHPPGDSVYWFRDVSSAKEDKETTIHQAHQASASQLPRARGEAAVVVAESRATADGAVAEADGRAESFRARAGAVAQQRRVLEHLLWLETTEAVLDGKRLYILPPGSSGGLSLWQPIAPSTPHASPPPIQRQAEPPIERP